MAKIRIGIGSDFRLNDQKLGLGENNPQERLDVAGVAKGQDLKVTGISSLTAYEGFLRADHQIAENTTLSFDQGPSASLSGEIIVGTGVTVTIASVGLGTTMVGNGSGTIENTIDTTDVTRAGGSEIECLKVFNTFTPPNGGTNERPYAPKPGELYYNYDFKTIEFFDGYGWRQVDNTTRSGRMLIGGGYQTPGNQLIDIQSFNINILGNSIDFGDLTDNRSNIASCSSSIRGLFVGGANPSYKNIIDYVTISSSGNAIDFGDLSTTNRAYIGATSSSTRGIFGGGYTSSPSGATVNIIDYVEISTIGNALDFGDLFTGRYSAGAVSNGIRAVWAGGNTPGKSIIDFVTIASKGNSVFFGDLTYARRNAAGASFSSNVRGVFAGGRHPTVVGQIDYITIASEGNAIYFGDLSVTRQRSAGSSTQIRGVWAGGNTPDSSNVIDYVTIASTGNATDFGDLYKDTGSTAGCSDSHGGLGGF